MNIKLIDKIVILNPFHLDIFNLEISARNSCDLLNRLNLSSDSI